MWMSFLTAHAAALADLDPPSLCAAEQRSQWSLEGHDGSLDDVSTFAQLVLLDSKGRGKADDVTVGGLGQQSIVTEAQANLPSVIICSAIVRLYY